MHVYRYSTHISKLQIPKSHPGHLRPTGMHTVAQSAPVGGIDLRERLTLALGSSSANWAGRSRIQVPGVRSDSRHMWALHGCVPLTSGPRLLDCDWRRAKQIPNSWASGRGPLIPGLESVPTGPEGSQCEGTLEEPQRFPRRALSMPRRLPVPGLVSA